MDIEKLKEELERDEGRRDRPYKCPAGKWTVGVGWNLEAMGLPCGLVYLVDGGECMKLASIAGPYAAVKLAEAGFTIPDLHIDALLERSIETAADDARELVHDFENLSDDRQRAFVNMAFNLGRQRMAGFRKMLAAAKRYDWAECLRRASAARGAPRAAFRA
jgi:lysozyme